MLFIELNPLTLRADATYPGNLHFNKIIISFKQTTCLKEIIIMLKK